jgi:hypothetical protein
VYVAVIYKKLGTKWRQHLRGVDTATAAQRKTVRKAAAVNCSSDSIVLLSNHHYSDRLVRKVLGEAEQLEVAMEPSFVTSTQGGAKEEYYEYMVVVGAVTLQTETAGPSSSNSAQQQQQQQQQQHRAGGASSSSSSNDINGDAQQRSNNYGGASGNSDADSNSGDGSSGRRAQQHSSAFDTVHTAAAGDNIIDQLPYVPDSVKQDAKAKQRTRAGDIHRNVIRSTVNRNSSAFLDAKNRVVPFLVQLWHKVKDTLLAPDQQQLISDLGYMTTAAATMWVDLCPLLPHLVYL